MPTSLRPPCITSPPTGRHPCEPGFVHSTIPLPVAAKSRSAATRCAAHTHVPEKRTMASRSSIFLNLFRHACASALVARMTSCSISSTLAARKAALACAIRASSMKGVPIGSSSPSLWTPKTMKATLGVSIGFFLLYSGLAKPVIRPATIVIAKGRTFGEAISRLGGWRLLRGVSPSRVTPDRGSRSVGSFLYSISATLTTCPVAADFSAARQATTAAIDSSGVMTVGGVWLMTQFRK